ncbi:MAG TPA: hypothetical protein VF789_13730 [Thermoanaerobaculia bacterium]
MIARENPFAVQRVLAIRYRLAGISWDELLDRLTALRSRAALVGPHGHGKTTLLEDLGARLAGRGFRVRSVTLHEGDRRLAAPQRRELFKDLAASDFLLLDGAEQLGRLAWLEVRTRARSAGGLVITSHRSGLLPTLHECRTTPELLAGIVSELLGKEAAVEELFARHEGNVRGALRELYDSYAAHPNPHPLAPSPDPSLPPSPGEGEGFVKESFPLASPANFSSSPGVGGREGSGEEAGR